MFTGIIAQKAKVVTNAVKHRSLFLSIEKPKGWKLSLGESISVQGVCLTVKGITKKEYAVELMPETLKKTAFGESVPKEVNLERSLVYGNRLSGHFVTGHIDAVGKVEKIIRKGRSQVFYISYPKKFRRLLVEKGSVAVDGVSLTVVETTLKDFSVALLPYTLTHTTLGKKEKGAPLNLEFDILAKYLYRKL